MRRNGRQHGMVIFHERYSESSRGKYRMLNKLQTVPTTKFMTKVPSKPTNHSRYTSRCHRARCYACNDWSCHDYPINKSRSKSKGTYKHFYKYDVSINHLLVSHRIVGSGHGDKWVRFDCGSVKSILDQLNGSYCEYVKECHDDGLYDYGGCDMNLVDRDEVEKEIIGSIRGFELEGEDEMDFYFIELVGELLDEEDDWCL